MRIDKQSGGQSKEKKGDNTENPYFFISGCSVPGQHHPGRFDIYIFFLRPAELWWWYIETISARENHSSGGLSPDRPHKYPE
jgi:hypothetical protein